MSADNSILVLTSRGADGRPEYRVAHVQNVEMADYHDVAERDEYLRCYFDEKAVVYRSQQKAWRQAVKLHDEQVFVEYGIVTVNLGGPFPGTAGVSKSASQKGARKRRKRSASLNQVLRLKRQMRSLIRRVAALEAAAQRR
jgi:hypothetical protein